MAGATDGEERSEYFSPLKVARHTLTFAVQEIGPEVDSTPSAKPNSTLPLHGTHVTLITPNSTDISNFWKSLELWTGDKRLFDYLPWEAPHSAEELGEQIKDLEEKRGFVVYGIRVREGGKWECKGVIAYLNVHAEHRELEVGGVLFSRALQGSVAATEAQYLMLKNVFERDSPGLGGDSLPYRRVCWKCNNLNTKSRYAAERLGYKYEGTFRNHMIVKGRSRDSDWLSIIDKEWPLVGEALEQWLRKDNFDKDGQQRARLQQIRNEIVAE